MDKYGMWLVCERYVSSKWSMYVVCEQSLQSLSFLVEIRMVWVEYAGKDLSDFKVSVVHVRIQNQTYSTVQGADTSVSSNFSRKELAI